MKNENQKPLIHDPIRITICYATEQDVPAIFNIEQQSLNLWKEEYFINEFENDFSKIIVAKNNGTIIAFVVIWLLPDEIQIQNIAVTNSLRYHKIGTRLLHYVIKHYNNVSRNAIILEVNSNNTSAIQFYKDHSFNEIGYRKNYYKDGDAIVLKKIVSNYEN